MAGSLSVMTPLAAAALAAAPVLASAWSPVLTATAPEARRNGSAVYDPKARRAIVFGGIGNAGHLNDVWAFDLATRAWSRLTPTGAAPEPRLGHDAVYDPAGHQMLVWAGQQGSKFFSDTWALDLATLRWTNLTPAATPRPRYGSASVFDPAGARLLTFGGFTDQGRFHDTQAFSPAGRTWSDLSPASGGPQERCLHTAALDRAGRMLVYGGQRAGPLDDLWAFDPALRTWTELTPAIRPPGRFFSTSFVDRFGRFTVFGGSTSEGLTNELWTYTPSGSPEAGSWALTPVPAPPSPRSGAMGAYVPEDGRLVLFGGNGGSGLLADTWELQTDSPATLFVPSATRAEGAGGAFYTTRLDLAATGTTAVTYTLKLLGHDQDGRQSLAKTFALAPGSSVAYGDLLGDVFGVTGTYGAVQITASGPLVGLAQTSTPSAGGGTYGQAVPVFTETDWIRAGATRSIVGVREDSSFRTNLVLVNATEEAVEVTVGLLSSGGVALGSKVVSLPPLAMTQLSRAVRELGVSGDVTGARFTLTTATPAGAFVAYGSVIDSVTNDPRTLLPR